MIQFIKRLIEAIKNQGSPGPSRKERRQADRMKGRMKNGRWWGGQVTKKAHNELSIERELSGK